MITITPTSTPRAGNGVEDTRLKAAQQSLSGALRALTARDYALAELLAEQAQWEAALAERHALSAGTRKAAHESLAAAQALRLQIDRIDVLLFDHKPTH